MDRIIGRIHLKFEFKNESEVQIVDLNWTIIELFWNIIEGMYKSRTTIPIKHQIEARKAFDGRERGHVLTWKWVSYIAKELILRSKLSARHPSR